MPGMTELAKMFKERDLKNTLGIQSGTVIKDFPDIEIRLSEFIVLDKRKLLFAAHLMNGYERNIKFTDSNCGITNDVNDGGQGASSHSHTIAELNVNTTLEYTDTLEKGDTVIVIPTSNEQKFYVIDKVVTI